MRDGAQHGSVCIKSHALADATGLPQPLLNFHGCLGLLEEIALPSDHSHCRPSHWHGVPRETKFLFQVWVAEEVEKWRGGEGLTSQKDSIRLTPHCTAQPRHQFAGAAPRRSPRPGVSQFFSASVH